MRTCVVIAVLAVAIGFVASGNDMFRLVGSGGKNGLFQVVSLLGAKDVGKEVGEYDTKQFGENAGREQSMVNNYYNLATDFYEYGWGSSFHFAHTLKDETHDDSLVRHEQRIASTLGLKAGDSTLDVGCGVGGPARNIASFSKSKVTGITINDYQVKRANEHTVEANLTDLVDVVQGDFTKMGFKDSTFDYAYAIEATCHSADLQDVYSEVFRVLKPGGRFASYEWLSTAKYDAANEEHKKILFEIEYGDGLPPIHSFEHAVSAAKAVGFELVSDEDLAMDKEGTRPWYSKLDMGTFSMAATHYFCTGMEFLGLAEEGTVQTHAMLIRGAKGLVTGGKAEIFTPMHLMVFEKPAAKKPAAKKAEAKKSEKK